MAFGDWLAQKLAGATLNSGGGNFAPPVVPSAPYQPTAAPNQAMVDMLRAAVAAGLRSPGNYTSGFAGGVSAPAPVIPPPANPAQAALYPHLVQAMQDSLPGTMARPVQGPPVPTLLTQPVQGPGAGPITPGSSLPPDQMALLAALVKAQAAGTSGGGLLGGIGDAIGGAVSGAANTATNLANAGGDAIAGAASGAANAIGGAAGQVNQSLTDTLNASGQKVFGDKSLGERVDVATQSALSPIKQIVSDLGDYVTINPLGALKDDAANALHAGGEVVGWGQKKLEETQAEIAYKAATGDPVAKAEKWITTGANQGPVGKLIDTGTKAGGMNLYAWADANPEAVKKAYEQGYDVYGEDGKTVIRHVDAGAGAVAAAFDDSMNFLQKMGYQTLTDPTLLLLGAGPLARSLKAVTAAEDAGIVGQTIAKGANVLGDVAHGADVAQKMPEEVLKGVGTVGKAVAGKVADVIPGGENVVKFFTEPGAKALDATLRAERTQAMKQALIGGRDFLFGEGGIASPASPLDGGITPGAAGIDNAATSVVGDVSPFPTAADGITPATAATIATEPITVGAYAVKAETPGAWVVHDEAGKVVAGPFPKVDEANAAALDLAKRPATEVPTPAQAATAPTEPVVPAESAAPVPSVDAADLANRKAKYAIADYMHEATKRIADSSEEATRAAYQRMQDAIGEKAARTQQTIALNESAAKRRYPAPNLDDFGLTPADVAPSSQAVAPDVVAPSATEIAPTQEVVSPASAPTDPRVYTAAEIKGMSRAEIAGIPKEQKPREFWSVNERNEFTREENARKAAERERLKPDAPRYMSEADKGMTRWKKPVDDPNAPYTVSGLEPTSTVGRGRNAGQEAVFVGSRDGGMDMEISATRTPKLHPESPTWDVTLFSGAGTDGQIGAKLQATLPDAVEIGKRFASLAPAERTGENFWRIVDDVRGPDPRGTWYAGKPGRGAWTLRPDPASLTEATPAAATDVAPTPDVAPPATEAAPPVEPLPAIAPIEPTAAPTAPTAPAGPPVLPQSDISFLGPKQGGQRAVDQAAYVIGPKNPDAARAFFAEYEPMAADARLKFGRSDWNAPIPQPENIKGLPRAEQDAARSKFAVERLQNRASKVAEEMQFANDTRAIWERTITPATGDAAPAVTMSYRDRLSDGNRRVFDDLFPKEGESFRSARVIEDDQQWFGQMMHDVNSIDDIARGAATDVWNAVVEQALGPDNFAAKDVRAVLSNAGPQGKALANDLRDMRVAILGEESVGSRGQLMAADARKVVTSGKRIATVGDVQPKTYDFTLTYEDGTATTLKGFDTKKAAIQARESILQSHREAHAVEAGKLNQGTLFDQPAATTGATEPAATDIANQPAPWETQSASDLPPAATEMPPATNGAATAPPAKPEPTGRWLREPDPNVGRLTPEKQEQINLWDKAKAAPNMDEGIKVFEDYATGKAGGARDEFMRRAANGRTAYENSEPGKLWRKVDGWIDNFTTDYNAYRPDGLNPHPSGRPPIEGSTAFPPEKPPLTSETTPFAPETTVGGDRGAALSLSDSADPVDALFQHNVISEEQRALFNQNVSVGGKWIKDPETGKLVLDGAKERRLFDVFAENIAKTGDPNEAIKMTFGALSDKMPSNQRFALLRAYKAVNDFGRNHKMFGWTRGGLGIATDAIGDAFSQITSGHVESLAQSFNPKTIWGVFKDIRAGTEAALANTEGGRIVNRLEVAPRDLYGLAQRSETNYGDEMGVARFAAKLLRKSGVDDEAAIKWGARVTRPLADKDIMIGREAADITRRWSLYTTQLKRELTPRRTAFFDLIREKAATAGNVDAEKLIAGLGDEFGPSDVTRLAKEAGFADGQVENLSRTWRSDVTAMDKAAWAEQNRVALDFSATRADEALKNVFLFHTWQTRAAPLYLQNALRNPVLANFYNHVAQNMQTECEKRAGGTCGYLQLMSTGAGYAMYMNPTTLISSAIINLDPQFDDVNATTLDKILKQMPAQVAPAFQGIISALGYSSRVAPDFLSLDADRKIMGGVVNYGRAHGWFGPDAEHSMGDAFYAKALALPAKVVQAAEEFVGQNLPGAKPPKWFDPHAQDNQLVQARMRDLVYQEYDVPLATSIDDLAANYPQAYDALLGPDGALNAWHAGKANTYSDQAFKDYTSGLLDRALLTPVMPGGVQIRSESQDALTARRDQAKAFSSKDDANIAQSALALPRLGGTAAVDLQYGQGKANVAGPEAGRELVKGWNKIVYGPSNQSPEDIARRKLIADEWVASHGSNAMALYQRAKTEKQAVIDANPESKAYQQWAGDIRNMDAPAFRNYLKSNPNYARYLDNLPADTKADPQKYESAKASTNAYLASQGEGATVFDPVAISTNSGKAPALTNPGGAGQPSYAKKSTAQQVTDDLRKYQTDSVLYNQALATFTGNPRASLEGMNPMLRSVMATRMQSMGINQPSLPASVRRYQAWAAAQPAGSDTSIPRYAAWHDAVETQVASLGYDANTVIDAALSGVDLLANTGVVQSATSLPAAS